MRACLSSVQGKLSMYQNNVRRQQQAIAQFKMQRRQDNLVRRAAGARSGPRRRLHARCLPLCRSLRWVVGSALRTLASPWPSSMPPPTARCTAGEETLSEDPPEGMFKAVAEPNQLDNMLLSNQMASYCQHINTATEQVRPGCLCLA